MLALYHHPTFDFSGALGYAIVSFVRNENATIPLPRYESGFEIPMKPVVAAFMLDDVKDADVLTWILSIQNGYRTTSLKAVMRFMLEAPNIDVLMVGRAKAIASPKGTANPVSVEGKASQYCMDKNTITNTESEGQPDDSAPITEWGLYDDNQLFENY